MTRIGAQVPRIATLPPAVSRAAAQDAIEMADIAGLVLDPWQRLVLESGLGETADGKWSAFEACLIVPRRNGKSALLQAMILAALYVWQERTVIYSAHRFDTAQETFAELRALIEGSDELSEQVRKVYTANGKEAIILRNGCRVKFMSRAKGSGRGFSGDRIIFDEAFNLPGTVLGAMVPTLAARSLEAGSNPQIWYASSAAMSSSAVLHSLRRRATGSDPGRLYFADWSAEETATDDDVDAWYQANPALGIRIAEDFVRDEMTALAHSPQEFRRERLGIWDAEPFSQQDLPIDAEVWMDRVDAASQPGPDLVFGVGVMPDLSAVAIGVVSRRADGLAHLEVIESRKGMAWVEDWLRERLPVHRPKAFAVDVGGPSMALVPDLTRVCGEFDVELVKMSGRDYAGACSAFVAAVAEDRVRHLGQAWLSTAIGGAGRRALGESWVWDLRAATVNVAPLVAVTVALRALEQLPADAEWFVY